MKSFLNAVFTSVAALAIALAIAAPTLRAVESDPLSKQELKALIKSAQAPSEHMKIAAYFRVEAKRLKENAKDHNEMAAEYFRDPSRYPIPKYPTMGQHCRELAAAYSTAADKAMSLALEHETMAKESAR
jgi:hypothetical protein